MDEDERIALPDLSTRRDDFGILGVIVQLYESAKSDPAEIKGELVFDAITRAVTDTN